MDDIQREWPQRKVHVDALDVMDYGAVFRSIGAAQAALGSLDIVVANAGSGAYSAARPCHQEHRRWIWIIEGLAAAQRAS